MAWRPSWSCDQHNVNQSIFHVSKRIHTKFGQNGPVVSEKNKFSIFNIHMEMTLTLNTHVINLISCPHLPTFGSQAALASAKSTVFTFLYRKA